MKLDELKLYTVRINNGSGCLFQPILNGSEFTYILTAKHLFENGVRDENDEIIPPLPDGTDISIVRQVNIGVKWQKISIPLILKRGETYFPHKDADVAILKINLLANFDKIVSNEITRLNNTYYLNGFPKQPEDQEGEEYTTYSIRELEASGDYSQNAQLDHNVLNKLQVEGMSGGGILSIQDDLISIIGIQSRVKHPNFANGKICFVPMKYFAEIVNYKEYNGLLTPLHPPYLGKFDFLRDIAFTLEVDFINENKIEDTRTYLRNKAVEVINSGITPISIKELFNNKLLIDEDEINCLDTKNIWIGWLEFLTIFNIVKDENIDEKQLVEIFDCVRLKYTHVEDCTTLFKDKLSKSDYTGLKKGNTVVINSKNAPKKPFKFLNGIPRDITKVQDVRGFRTDLGIDPFQSFNFVHLDYYKT